MTTRINLKNMEKRCRLELIGITYNQIESGVYALILEESGGSRRIPIIIGFPEAQAIECKLQEVSTPRPLTHDTMANTLHAFGIRLEEVEIYKLPNGVFAANLLLSDGVTQKRVDSRSSDAVALAIRVGAPIFTSETVMVESAFDPKEHFGTEDSDIRESLHRQEKPAKASKTRINDDLRHLSVQRLKKAMDSACAREDYEEAARIKAELDSRNDKPEES